MTSDDDRVIGSVIPTLDLERLLRIEAAAKKVVYELDLGLVKVRERVVGDLRKEIESE